MRKWFLNVLVVLIATLVSGCSSNGGDDEEFSVYGTYNVTSVIPNLPMDGDADGTYDTTDLMDQANCSFTLSIATNDTYVLGFYYSLSQTSTCCDNNGLPTLEPLICFSQTVTGTISQTAGSVVLTADDGQGGAEDRIAVIEGNNLIINESRLFYTEVNGQVEQRVVQLAITFSK